MQIRQLFVAVAVVAHGTFVSLVQATPVPQPWAFVQWGDFNASAALLANPSLLASAYHTVSQAEGFVRGYHGRQVEDPNLFHVAFEWTSINAQKNFERSHKYPQVAAAFRSATEYGNLPTFIHLPFVGDYTIAFDSPITEIVRPTLGPGRTAEELITAVGNAYTGALNAAPGIHVPATRAEIVEQPRTFFLTGGWDRVEDHTAAVSVEPALSLIAVVAAIVPGSEATVKHTALTKII